MFSPPLNSPSERAIPYQISPTLEAFLIRVEGERLVAYLCSAGHWTIGVGHTGLDVTPGLRITPETSRKLLLRDLSWATNCVSRNVHVALTEPQWIALVSFVFNMGEQQFLSSTLLRLLNLGQYDQVPTQLRRWNKETVNGVLVVNKGLTARRESEITIWNTPA